MGVLDRLRRRRRAPGAHSAGDAAASVPPTAPAPDSGGEAPPARGDFMLLPPMELTFDMPEQLRRPLDDFLITHRPTTVTTEPLAHQVDPKAMGVVSGRARRRARSRMPMPALDHRLEPMVVDDAFEDEVRDLPARPPVRRLPAVRPPRGLGGPRTEGTALGGTQPPLVAPPVGVMPSIEEVRRSMAPAPVLSTDRSAESGTGPAPRLESLQEAARREESASAPVLRPRPGPAPAIGGSAEPSAGGVPTEAPRPEGDLAAPGLNPFAPADDRDVDLDALAAPRATELPPLQGITRVRGAQPPGPSEGSAPVPPPSVAGVTPPVIPAVELVHPSAPGTAELPETPGPDRPTVPGTSDLPGAETGSGVATESSASHGPAAETVPAPQAPAPSESRPLLGARVAPVPAGRTGIQRKERTADESSPGRDRARPSRPQTPKVATPSRGRVIQVPDEVRRAVASSAGSAPDTVTVHEGEHADEQAREVNAHAFTRDGEVFLASDASLDTPRGQALLAHELTHVVQQKGGAERMPAEGTRDASAHEAAAERAEQALGGSPVSPTGAGAIDTQDTQGTAEPVAVPQGMQRRRRSNAIKASINSDRSSSVGSLSDDPLYDDEFDMMAMHSQSRGRRHASVQSPTPLANEELHHVSTRVAQPPAPLAGTAKARAAGAGPKGNLLTSDPLNLAYGATLGRADAALGGAIDGMETLGSSITHPMGETIMGGFRKADSLLGGLIGSMDSPAAQGSESEEEDEDKRARLEREADMLFPFIRSRLRRELFRDRERRGRLVDDGR